MNKSRRRIAIAVAAEFALAGVMLSAASGAWAQAKAASPGQQIAGIWKLVSTTNTSKEGVVTKNPTFGPNPKGQFIFTSSGHYSSVNTNPNLPKFKSGNRMTGTPEEYKAVVQGSTASYGTYSVSADGKTLTIKQEAGTWAARNGVEEKRALTLAGDDMKYSVASSIGGTSELVYKRVK
jgi:Lipocalin-like domain